jgi:hypothetical protein
MDKFIIILPNDKIKTYRLFIVFLNLINSTALTLILINLSPDSVLKLLINGLIGLSVAPFLIWLFVKKNRDFQINQMLVAMLLSSIAWFIAGNLLAGLSVALLSMMSFKVIKRPTVIFQKNGIDYPSFPRKIIKWNDTASVQIKDGILTIDLKNNQLFQFTLIEKDNPELDEEAFNSFVKECISITE